MLGVRHLLERDLTGELHAHHDHARNPEEQDIVASLEQRSRVELGEIRRRLRPLEDREREQPGGEPRVQHIVVLLQHKLLARVSARTRSTMQQHDDAL
jgi:hypothetical protein